MERHNDEPGYVPVPRRLMVERMLLGTDGNQLIERRFFLFDGRVRFVQSSSGRKATFVTRRSMSETGIR